MKRITATVALGLVVASVAGLDRAPEATGRLAYARKGWLWVAATDMAGRPVRVVKPRRLCRLWPVTSDGGMSLHVSPTGEYVAIEHWVTTRRPGAPYGTPEHEYCGIWLTSTKRNARLRKVATGVYPSWSPDGKQLAFVYVPGGDLSRQRPESRDVRILDLTRSSTRTLRSGASEPFWSADGTEVAVVDEVFSEIAGGWGRRILVLDAASGRVRSQSPVQVNPIAPILSPNSRYLAYHPHLSRPLTGHIILDRKTGRFLRREFRPAGYAPGPLLDWSRDGRWLLWAFRVPHPENDGYWKREDIWVVSFDRKTKRRIGVGGDGQFSPDGRHVLWLRQRQKSKPAEPVCDLVCTPIGKGMSVVISTRVHTFSLARRGRASW